MVKFLEEAEGFYMRVQFLLVRRCSVQATLTAKGRETFAQNQVGMKGNSHQLAGTDELVFTTHARTEKSRVPDTTPVTTRISAGTPEFRHRNLKKFLCMKALLHTLECRRMQARVQPILKKGLQPCSKNFSCPREMTRSIDTKSPELLVP